MSAASRLEGMAAFLAGAGLGAALARGLAEPGRGFAGRGRGNFAGTGGAAPVAADLGRMRALLGEIRGLLAPQEGRPAGTGDPGGKVGVTPAPEGEGAGWEGPPARLRTAGPYARETRDRPGPGIGLRAETSEGTDLLALGAAAIGAATAFAAIRKGGKAAAWPALAGFLAAGAWGAWKAGTGAAGSGRRGHPASMPESRAGRSGRPAMP